MGFATECIHAGQEPDPTTGAVTVPIYQTSTYVQEGLGRHKGYEYARTHNLTRRTLERNLAALEGGTDACCFASGMAATQAVLTLVGAGQRVVVSDNVYGGTHRLFTKVLARYGVEFAFLDATDPEAFEGEAGRFDLLWIETPTNPLMKVCDIRALAGPRAPPGGDPGGGQHLHEPVLPAPARPRGRRRGALDDQVPERALGQRGRGGGGPGGEARRAPALRAERGRRDPLALRLLARAPRHEDAPPAHARHEENACAVAPFLYNHPKVGVVFWPGFPDHPGHAVHKHQASGFGALVSFDLGSLEAARRMLGRVRLCSLGESLGGVETLISHPATMTHAGYTQAERDGSASRTASSASASAARTRSDLVADLDQALGGRIATARRRRDALVQPGEVGRVAGLDRQRHQLRELVRVEPTSASRSASSLSPAS
jgi:cystathionine beta-lyase/cystathionine gamma-synthase